LDSEDSLNTTKLIYNIIYERYQLEWQRTNQIENKATNIVGFVGIIFGLLSSTGIYLLEQKATNGVLYLDCFWFYLFSLIFFITTIFFSLSVLYLKKWKRIPETKFLIENYVKKGVESKIMLEDIYIEFSNGVIENSMKNDVKVDYLRYSFISFGMGILLTAFFILSLLIKI
jgi:hypothetical protein